MKQSTELKAIRLYAGDYALLQNIRATLEQRNPGHQVSLADAVRLRVGSGHAALTGDQSAVRITAPPLTIRGDQAA